MAFNLLCPSVKIPVAVARPNPPEFHRAERRQQRDERYAGG